MQDFPGYIDIPRASLLPDRCCFCGKVVLRKVRVCKTCKKEVAVIESPRCIACGASKKDCKCKGKANFYNGIAAAFYYKGIVRNGIALWKFRGAERNVSFFADTVIYAINRTFPHQEFDMITFVPQTEKEMRERMYNQGEKLAEAVGEKTGIPVYQLLKKLYDTKSQRSVSFIGRSGNVFGTFDCFDCKFFEDKNILLVDDVKTSGSTINECAKMLQISGASTVFCAVIATV